MTGMRTSQGMEAPSSQLHKKQQGFQSDVSLMFVCFLFKLMGKYLAKLFWGYTY